MEFEYKVTVIVPVYNAEKNIDRTMQSLFQQTIAQELMEVILIDDGSTDNSPCICDRYAEEHDNVRVIHQENKGVSAARNAGIRAARGKYLLYLDSDDTLSKESIKNIVEFFDAHYNEVDLVTYHLISQFRNGVSVQHARFEYLEKTGVYNLDKNPYICQTTINVCVKNRLDYCLYFNTTLEVAEDQLYNVQTLERTGKIGFVNDAEYIYMRRDGSLSSDKGNSPCSYCDYITVFQMLLNIGQRTPSMLRYCENIILHNFSWKIKGNSFLPPPQGKNNIESFTDKLEKIVNQISIQSIMKYPKMDIAYKYYLLSLKTEKRPFAFCDNFGIKIINYNGELSSENPLLIVVNHLQDSPTGFYMLAYLKCFAFAFTEEEPKLFIILPNAKRENIPVFHSQFSCFWTNFETSRFFAFHYTIPWTCSGKIEFEVSLHGQRYTTHFWYSAKGKVHPDIGCYYLNGRQDSLLCRKDSLEVVPANAPALQQAKRDFEERLFKGKKKQWLARQLLKRFQHWRTWLYFDSHDSLDNGYYQFLHDIEKRDGIRRYYVYHMDNLNLIQGKFPGKAGRALIPFGSVQHKCLMAAAEKILTSFSGRSCFLPFDPDTYQYYSDLFHYEVVYLQHGVMHAKLPNMYSKEKVWQVDQVVVSTKFEKENLLQLGYREKDILTTGMPRLDQLVRKQSSQAEKRILFAPSWRRNLVRTVDGVQLPLEIFYHSAYYCDFSSFLRDETLHELLEKYDAYLDVQIHPMFSCYADSFLTAETDRIRMIRFANAADYLACITDFSSFLFDFVYMEKPVISYFPDREAFQAGAHTYSDFYYPLEDGFALYCEDKDSAIGFLRQLCEENFSLPPRLADRAKELYFSREANHREELYRTLIGDR